MDRFPLMEAHLVMAEAMDQFLSVPMVVLEAMEADMVQYPSALMAVLLVMEAVTGQSASVHTVVDMELLKNRDMESLLVMVLLPLMVSAVVTELLAVVMDLLVVTEPAVMAPLRPIMAPLVIALPPVVMAFRRAVTKAPVLADHTVVLLREVAMEVAAPHTERVPHINHKSHRFYLKILPKIFKHFI